MFVSKTSNNKCAKFRFWTRTIIFTPSVQIWMPPQTVLRTWASGYIWQHIFLQKVLQITYSIALPARRPPENWCRKYLYKKLPLGIKMQLGCMENFLKKSKQWFGLKNICNHLLKTVLCLKGKRICTDHKELSSKIVET